MVRAEDGPISIRGPPLTFFFLRIARAFLELRACRQTFHLLKSTYGLKRVRVVE